MAYASATTLTVQEIGRTGKSVTEQMTAATATHGEKFINDGKTFVRIKNGDGSPVTATINTNRSVDGLTLPNQTVTIAATGNADGLDFQDIGPFPPGTFNQTDGYVWVTLSAVTSVTIGAYRLQNS
jgi:hypothetical protein